MQFEAKKTGFFLFNVEQFSIRFDLFEDYKQIKSEDFC